MHGKSGNLSRVRYYSPDRGQMTRSRLRVTVIVSLRYAASVACAIVDVSSDPRAGNDIVVK